MNKNPFGALTADNPFFGLSEKANWARLTRLGGDRVSILFDDLRRRVGVIEGLAEEVTYDAVGKSAAARYSVGEEPLFTAHVAAGELEISLRLDAMERDSLLAQKKISPAMRRALVAGHEEAGNYSIRFAVKNNADVGSVARLILSRSRKAIK